MARNLWIVGGRKADGRVVAGNLDLARAAKLQRLAGIRARVVEEFGAEADDRALANETRKRWREADREARKLEAELRKVGKASRRAAREQAKPIYVYAQPYRGGHVSEREIKRFDSMFHPKRTFERKPDGLHSFHCKFTSRGFGDRRKDRSRVYKPGEAVKHVRYILRELAREIARGGLVSNISLDPDEIAGFFAALEELESHDRDNANVYMSLVISLPHELTPEGREQVLAEICELLAEHDLPHVGVLHAPDPRGDQRNFHTHIMFSLRPCEIEGPGRYAFSPDKYSDLNDETFIYSFRQKVAGILNAAMEREKLPRRFTGLSDADRGLEPRAKGTGKSTPGKKHRERRQEDLAHMQRERALCFRRSAVLEQLTARLGQITAEPARDRRQEIAIRRTAALAILVQAKSSVAGAAAARARRIGDVMARMPLPAVTPPEVVSTPLSGAMQPDVANERRPERTPSSPVTVAAAENPAPGHAQDPDGGAQAAGTSDPVARTQPPARDVERRRAIAAAARQLRTTSHPPQVKRGARFVIASASASAFRNIDRFEAEDIIQRIHANKWQQTLVAVRKKVEGDSRSPFAPGDGPAQIDPDYFDQPLRWAYRSAKNAPDMVALLTELRELWRAREEKDRQAAELKVQLKREVGNRRTPAVDRVRKRIDELKTTGRWSAAEVSAMSENVGVISQAVLESRIAMRSSGGAQFFSFETEGLKFIAAQLGATHKGRQVLVALGRITEHDPFDPAELPVSMTLFPPARQSSPTNSLAAPGIQPGRTKDGNER